MYEAHFGLSKNPFMLSPDPQFLLVTEQHREALVGLTYSIMKRKGFAVLIGEAGTGKTTLVRCLLGVLRKPAVVVAPTGVAALVVGVLPLT